MTAPPGLFIALQAIHALEKTISCEWQRHDKTFNIHFLGKNVETDRAMYIFCGGGVSPKGGLEIYCFGLLSLLSTLH